MSIYELSTLTVRVGAQTDAHGAMGSYFSSRAGPEPGKLVGCWLSDIGHQNRVLVLRKFEGAEELRAERERLLRSADPFGCGAVLAGLMFETLVLFPGFPAVDAGPHGPVYEFRRYRMKIGGLASTLEAWEGALPGRAELSVPIVALYALNGPPQFVHVWAYASLGERETVRREAAARRLWPPSNYPSSLEPDMIAELYRPAAFSPLQ